MTKYKFLRKRYKSRTQSLYMNGAGKGRRYRRTWGYVYSPMNGLRIGAFVGLCYLLNGVFGDTRTKI